MHIVATALWALSLFSPTVGTAKVSFNPLKPITLNVEADVPALVDRISPYANLDVFDVINEKKHKIGNVCDNRGLIYADSDTLIYRRVEHNRVTRVLTILSIYTGPEGRRVNFDINEVTRGEDIRGGLNGAPMGNAGHVLVPVAPMLPDGDDLPEAEDAPLAMDIDPAPVGHNDPAPPDAANGDGGVHGALAAQNPPTGAANGAHWGPGGALWAFRGRRTRPPPRIAKSNIYEVLELYHFEGAYREIVRVPLDVDLLLGVDESDRIQVKKYPDSQKIRIDVRKRVRYLYKLGIIRYGGAVLDSIVHTIIYKSVVRDFDADNNMLVTITKFTTEGFVVRTVFKIARNADFNFFTVDLVENTVKQNIILVDDIEEIISL